MFALKIAQVIAEYQSVAFLYVLSIYLNIVTHYYRKRTIKRLFFFCCFFTRKGYTFIHFLIFAACFSEYFILLAVSVGVWWGAGGGRRVIFAPQKLWRLTHWSMFTSDCRGKRRLAVRYNVGFLEQNGCAH